MIVNLYRVDPKIVSSEAFIFDASELAEKLNVPLPRSARSKVDGEFLVKHNIRASAVIWIDYLQEASTIDYAPRPALPPSPSSISLQASSTPRYATTDDDDDESEVVQDFFGRMVAPDEDQDTAADEGVRDVWGRKVHPVEYAEQDLAIDRIVEDNSDAVIEDLDCTPNLVYQSHAVEKLLEGLKNNLERWLYRP
jgi:hypothetical protein